MEALNNLLGGTAVPDVLFYVFAALTLLCGVLVIANPFSRSPVTSAMFLVLTIISMAGLFVLLHAFFLAAVQILVYAGAVMVLFLFVIMLLGVDRRESLEEPHRLQRPIALGLGVLLLLEVLVLAGRHWVTGAHSTRGALNDPSDGNVHNVASRLFTDFLWPFEITAVLLVIAVVGGVVLARRARQPPDRVPDRAA
jgi:NADH-quinone oxidoreductase subunit J